MKSAISSLQYRVAALFLILLTGPIVATGVQAADEAYRYGVNPGDQLQVYVWDDDTLSSDVLVAPDGTIAFPMVGSLDVLGASTTEIGERIAKALGDYMRSEPSVTVSLKSAAGNRIYVHGKVRKPGVYPISGRVDVMQALALAGGLDAYAKASQIRVYRREADAGQRMIEFDFERFRDGADLDSNVFLESGDVIVVP